MAKLFGVTGSIQVDTLLVDQNLRFTFKVERDDKPTPNKVECSIYNLTEESRKKTQIQDAPLIIEAGFPDTVARIFSGTVSKVSHVQTGPDIITKIIAGDGEKEWRSKRINESFSPGTRIQDVVKAIVDALGLKPGNALKALDENGIAKGLSDFANGKTISGLASHELKKMLNSAGYTFSIQDGALQVLQPDQANKLPTILLEPGTGLIGSPEYGETGPDKVIVLKAKSLLQPGLVPGRKVELRSLTKDGYFLVTKVTHTGDTIGTPWFSEVELKKLNTKQSAGLSSTTSNIA